MCGCGVWLPCVWLRCVWLPCVWLPCVCPVWCPACPGEADLGLVVGAVTRFYGIPEGPPRTWSLYPHPESPCVLPSPPRGLTHRPAALRASWGWGSFDSGVLGAHLHLGFAVLPIGWLSCLLSGAGWDVAPGDLNARLSSVGPRWARSLLLSSLLGCPWARTGLSWFPHSKEPFALGFVPPAHTGGRKPAHPAPSACPTWVSR